jgi:putative ABC transport system ATP-binding protein
MESSDQPVIICEDVGKTVHSSAGPITILDQLSFQANAGDTVAIVGQSGSGKTTLLSLLAGLDTSTAGQVILFQKNLQRLNEDQRAQIRNQSIGFVFQSFHLMPGFSALENVMLPLEINHDNHAEEKARQMLSQVGMGHRLNHDPSTLSGGEQQRVAIARAFVTEAPLLLADEPTGNLDQKSGDQIIRLLFEMNRAHGTTLVLVTHDISISNHCSRRLELRQGRLIEC